MAMRCSRTLARFVMFRTIIHAVSFEGLRHIIRFKLTAYISQNQPDRFPGKSRGIRELEPGLKARALSCSVVPTQDTSVCHERPFTAAGCFIYNPISMLYSTNSRVTV